MEKPTFNAKQLTPSADVAKRLMNYEQLYDQLQELERKDEERILRERIDRLRRESACIQHDSLVE